MDEKRFGFIFECYDDVKVFDRGIRSVVVDFVDGINLFIIL